MLDVGGQDATEAFEDVGHSDEAREILNGMLVGDLKASVCLLIFSFLPPELEQHSQLERMLSNQRTSWIYAKPAAALHRAV